MAHMKAMGVIFEKAVELQALRDVYANMLQGEEEMVHVGDIQPWSTGLGFGWEQKSCAEVPLWDFSRSAMVEDSLGDANQPLLSGLPTHTIH